jgi:hypothetical protein
MARAHGARAQMALAFETVYGTSPASGYRLMPFARTTLGAADALSAAAATGALERAFAIESLRRIILALIRT